MGWEIKVLPFSLQTTRPYPRSKVSRSNIVMKPISQRRENGKKGNPIGSD